MTYAVVLGRSVSPLQPSGPLKTTAMDTDPSESVVSRETANGRISSDMSGPLSDMPDGTKASDQIRPQFLFQVYVTHVLSWPG